MPTYEYRCRKCGVFEVTQRIIDPSLKRCPTCKGKTERLVSRSSFILKGSGWYATDYARKSTSTGSESTASDPKASPNGAQTSGAEGSSADGTPAAKPNSDKTSSKPSSEKPATAKSAD